MRVARRCVGADDGGCDGAFDGSDVGDSLALRKQAHFACQLIYDRGQATNGSEGRLTIAWEYVWGGVDQACSRLGLTWPLAVWVLAWKMFARLFALSILALSLLAGVYVAIVVFGFLSRPSLLVKGAFNLFGLLPSYIEFAGTDMSKQFWIELELRLQLLPMWSFLFPKGLGHAHADACS